jgi:hypothetical protein
MLLFFLPLVFSSALASGADHMTIACVGGKVYASPTTPAIENAVLLIEDGKIATVAPDPRSSTTSPSPQRSSTARGK